MMDKYEVAKTIGEEFNYPWIEEMNCFDGFPAKKNLLKASLNKTG
jgi:hypothetical protein